MAMSLTTPRSALRTINEDQSTLRAMKSKQASKPGTVVPVNNLFKKPLQTLNMGNGAKTQLRIHTDADSKQKVRTKEKVIVRPPEPLPEKELMHKFDPLEDLKPKTDKALIGVVERIRNWRPPCLFGAGAPDSDESDDEDKTKCHRDLPYIPPPPPEDPFDEFELANLSDLNIPDSIPVPTVDIDDLPIPFLDDSLDIEPNMGTLEIWETSTPASMSPVAASNRSRSLCSPVSPRDCSQDNSCGE